MIYERARLVHVPALSNVAPVQWKPLYSGSVWLQTLRTRSRLLSDRPKTSQKDVKGRQHTPAPTDPSKPTGSLKDILKDLKGPSRWVVIGSFMVLATAESTFWLKVIHAKFIAKDDEGAVEFLERCMEALRGYRRAWLPNYQRYYGYTLWGL